MLSSAFLFNADKGECMRPKEQDEQQRICLLFISLPFTSPDLQNLTLGRHEHRLLYSLIMLHFDPYMSMPQEPSLPIVRNTLAV